MPAWICTVKTTQMFGVCIVFLQLSRCIVETIFHPYRCTRVYGDSRCYLEPVECSSAFLKNESTTNHIYEY